MNNKKTKNLTLLALFIAIEAVMVMVPFLGFIPIGPLRATLLHVPVIIAAIVLGTKQGCLIGLVFGLSSLLMNTMQPLLHLSSSHHLLVDQYSAQLLRLSQEL